MGTRTPCFTKACTLFCVTTRGRERIFSKPRDSAMVSKKSIRKLLEAFRNWKPLVGLVTGWFENRGICVPPVEVPPLEIMYIGFGAIPEPTVVGVVPTL